MKKRALCYIAVLSILGSSCQFNQSVNKDLVSGAYSRGDGLDCHDIAIKINGETENRSKFIYGEKVNFIFNDLSGLIRENGKVYPGLSLYLVQNEIDTVLAHPDLLEDMKNGTELSPLQLQAHFISLLPFENEEKYKEHINIWDKKGDGSFVYELPFVVEGNELLQIEASNLKYSTIYLWDETDKHVVVDENVKIENTLILLLEGIEGFNVLSNTVFPAFSLNIMDSNGNSILSEHNILSDFQERGVDVEVMKKEQLPVTITFKAGSINNPCTLVGSLTDLNSDNRIDIRAQLEIN